MAFHSNESDRRGVLAGLAAVSLLTFGARAQAAGLGSGLNALLGSASDSALTKLAIPGTFYGDPAVRIALPLLGNLGGGLGAVLGGSNSGILGQVMAQGSKLGLNDGLVRKLNDAAGLAAHEAKPIFRTAIAKLSLRDVPAIASHNDGATQYLRTSAGSELTAKLRPLIDSALGKTGAFAALERLGKSKSLTSLAGIGHDKLGSSVTEQALNGIFKYIGGEEGRLRANPLGPMGSVLGGLLGKVN